MLLDQDQLTDGVGVIEERQQTRLKEATGFADRVGLGVVRPRPFKDADAPANEGLADRLGRELVDHDRRSVVLTR